MKRTNSDANGLDIVPGLGRPTEIVDGWEAFYYPLEALFPSGNSAQDLIVFYAHLKSRISAAIGANDQANELGLALPSGVALYCHSNQPLDWAVLLKYIEWIVSRHYERE